MASLYNLARMTTATVGTGNILLDVSVPGYLTFTQAGVVSGSILSYGVREGTLCEVGYGQYTSYSISPQGATLTWLAAGQARLASLGSDPIMRMFNLTLNSAQTPLVQLRITRVSGSGWDGHLYFVTAGHGEGPYGAAVADPGLAVGQTAVITFQPGTVSGTDWGTAVVTQIRIDLGSTASDTFDISWIRLGDNAVYGFNAVLAWDFASSTNSFMLTRTVLNSTDGGSPVSLTGSAQVYTVASATDILGNVRSSTSGNPTVLPSDFAIVVNNTVSAATTVYLPAVPGVNSKVAVLDGASVSQAYNITVNGNGNLIGASSTDTIRSNGASMSYMWDGARWRKW